MFPRKGPLTLNQPQSKFLQRGLEKGIITRTGLGDMKGDARRVEDALNLENRVWPKTVHLSLPSQLQSPRLTGGVVGNKGIYYTGIMLGRYLPYSLLSIGK